MNTEKLVLEIPYYSRSVQGVIWDFKTYCTQKNIKYRIKLCPVFEKEILGKGSFARFDYNGKKVLIDLQDNPTSYDFFDQYDFVFKRSFSKKIHYPSNVIPFGLRLDVFDGLWQVLIPNFTLFITDKRNRKELIRTIFNLLGFDHLGFNNLSRSWKKLNQIKKLGELQNKKVLFSTRLWENTRTGDIISMERRSIYEILKIRKDVVLNSLEPLKQSAYLTKLKECNIVVINNGVHNVPGVRLSELLLNGKIVLTTDLNVKIPGLDVYNCIIEYRLENLNKTIDNLDELKVREIMQNTYMFCEQFLAPGKRFEYMINLIN